MAGWALGHMVPMTTYATPTRQTNPNLLLDPLTYWRVSAFALSAVAILGIVLASISGGGADSTKDQALAFHGNHGLGLTWTHNAVHVVLAIAAFVFGFGNLSAGVTRTAAIVFGFVYVALGVVGFLLTNPLGAGLALNLGITLNAVHLLLGAWALAAGFAARY
jgi:heme/copper-type cytochrome/quinol oxidase subunit 2